MSHLLASVNPAAAAAIDGPAVHPNVPPEGAVVIYTMRPGHGRNGKNKFPAFVMGSDDRGERLDLLVFIDAGDMIDEQLVERARPGTEFHCWDWPDDANAALRGMRGTLASLHQRTGDLEDRIKALEAAVLGDFKAPKVSIIHIMQDFENRLRDLKTAPAKKGK